MVILIKEDCITTLAVSMDIEDAKMDDQLGNSGDSSDWRGAVYTTV